MGKLSGSTVVEVRFTRRDGQNEVIDVPKSNDIVPTYHADVKYRQVTGEKPNSFECWPQHGQDWI
jgi:hypothetical protein